MNNDARSKWIEAIVAQAGVVRPDGNMFTAEALRNAQDPDKGLHWDEDRQALVYRGPRPPESE